MQVVVLVMIVVVTTFNYLASQGWIHPLMRLLPEVLSILVAAYIVFYGVRTRFKFVRAVYWLLLGALLVIFICGLIVNSVATGVVLNGMRKYLSPLPFFILPAVYAFSSSQIKSQLNLLLVICLIQAPIAFDQRVTSWRRGYGSGDETIGTLMDSGTLSIFLISASCVLLALFLRRQIPWYKFFPLMLLILFPTMINETKATVFFLPLGFLTVIMVASARGQLITNFIKMFAAILVFAPLFVLFYDAYQPEHRPGVVEFFSDPETFESYKTKGFGIGDQDQVTQAPRGDSVGVAIELAMKNPIRMAFGVGAGNASISVLGPQFAGQYASELRPFLFFLFNHVLVELGWISMLLVLVLKWVLFQDARAVAASNGLDLCGLVALGWAGVIAIFVLGMMYNNMAYSPALSWLFWYFSGVIAAHRMRSVCGLASDRSFAGESPGGGVSFPLSWTGKK